MDDFIARITERKNRAEEAVSEAKSALKKAENDLLKVDHALEVFGEERSLSFREDVAEIGCEAAREPLEDSGISIRDGILQAMREKPYKGHVLRLLRVRASEIFGSEITPRSISNACSNLRRMGKVRRLGRKWYLTDDQKEIGPGDDARPQTQTTQKGGDA